jgi:hypothetical protein
MFSPLCYTAGKNRRHKLATPEAEQLDNNYKLLYITYYLISKLEVTNKMNDLLQEALARAIVPDETDLHEWVDQSTGQRDMLWMFEDVLHYLKTQSLTTEQQREVDHLMVEVKYFRQALEKNILLVTELQGPSDSRYP